MKARGVSHSDYFSRVDRLYRIGSAIIFLVIIAVLIFNLDIHKTGSPPLKVSDGQSQLGNMVSTRLEYMIFEMVNQEREAYDLPALKWNNQLRTLAYQHSEDMSTLNFFSHYNRVGEDHESRLYNAGIHYFSSTGENILEENIYFYDMDEIRGCTRTIIPKSTESLAREAVNGWMNSSGHRANILNDYDETGIGIFLDANNVTLYATQIFIKRADCGFKGGPCCGATLKFCYHPLECNFESQMCEGTISKISPRLAAQDEEDKFVPPRLC